MYREDKHLENTLKKTPKQIVLILNILNGKWYGTDFRRTRAKMKKKIKTTLLSWIVHLFLVTYLIL